MLKQVIWIDKTKFICKLVKGIMADHGVSCYTLEKADDFAYLLDDLRPELLVCDLKTISENLNQFKNQVREYQGQILTTASASEYENFDQFKFSGLIEKPLEVETLFKNVAQLTK